MARLTILDHPKLPTYVEFRLWAAAGRAGQIFRLGKDFNPEAGSVLWWEIIQVMTGRQVFYFRHFLDARDCRNFITQITQFLRGDCSTLGVDGQCPETGFTIRRVTAGKGDDELPELPDHYELEAWLSDVGFTSAGILKEQGVFAQGRMTFTHTTYNEGSVQHFMEALAAEMARALAGRWLDPRPFDPGASRWALAEKTNSLAYDFLAGTFHEDYFKRRKVEKTFSRWLARIPAGGTVLDIGCGHGSPVVGRLLDVGWQVTGIDPSASMIEKARQQYPQANFLHGTLLDLPAETTFAAACSFNALLYLDPIDLSFALLRLHAALPVGGMLFVYSYFDHPDWVGEPVDRGMGAPMWAWDYDVAAACAAVSKQGLFEVIQTNNYLPPGKRSGPYALVARRLA